MICKSCREQYHDDCISKWTSIDTGDGIAIMPVDPPNKTLCDCQHREIKNDNNGVITNKKEQEAINWDEQGVSGYEL